MGKERDEETGLYYYGARYYTSWIGRWTAVDPLASKFPSWSPFCYTLNNPINLTDPDGQAPYPVIRITKQKSGKKAKQRVLGFVGNDVRTEVDLYKVVVTDTEDENFKMEFSITRDAWTVEKGKKTASNVGFEPKNKNINHFTGKVMPRGYPKDNGTSALKLTQRDSEVVFAEPNEISVKMEYRDKEDVAAGVMIHVGGNYEKNGENIVAASEGCFGICNPDNSMFEPSNSYTNEILGKVQKQANKSKTNPGHIRVIIEKREGNEFPKTKELD